MLCLNLHKACLKNKHDDKRSIEQTLTVLKNNGSIFPSKRSIESIIKNDYD